MDRDKDIGVIIGIVIFLLLFVFIVVVFLASGSVKSINQISFVNSTTSGNFLSSCTTTSCTGSFVCDGSNFTCKLPRGSPCTNFTQCALGLICSGLCVTGATGGLNNYCPCNPGYSCQEQNNGTTVCKAKAGTSCTINNDCVSAICNLGICAAGFANSYPCTNNAQCASNNCNKGFCQTLGRFTGQVNSACQGNCIDFGGVAGATCMTSEALPVSCPCLDGPGAPGTCSAQSQGLLTSCGPAAFCANDLVCFDALAGVCFSEAQLCTCAFPYPDPNALAPGSLCIIGMQPGSLGSTACYNSIGLGCNDGGLCASGLCGGSSVMTAYNFSTALIPNLGVQFVSATSTAVQPTFPGPVGVLKPYKMFAFSLNNIDYIYLVDHNLGFLQILYNTITGTVVTDWKTLVPYYQKTVVGNITNEKTLIDVGLGTINEDYLVAFSEVISVNNVITQQNHTVYLLDQLGNISPFNVQAGSGIPGTQYTTTNVPLSIEYISQSPNNPVSIGADALIAFNGTVYVKSFTDPKYSIAVIAGGPSNGQQMIGVTGPVYYYYDTMQNVNGLTPPVCPQVQTPCSGTPPPLHQVACPSIKNIAFIKNFLGSCNPKVYEQVLQFSGNVAGRALPLDRFPSNIQYKVIDYSIYSPQDPAFGASGMAASSIIMLVNAYNVSILIDTMVAVSTGGITTLLPYRVGQSNRVVASGNAYYVLNVGSCT